MTDFLPYCQSSGGRGNMNFKHRIMAAGMINSHDMRMAPIKMTNMNPNIPKITPPATSSIIMIASSLRQSPGPCSPHALSEAGRKTPALPWRPLTGASRSSHGFRYAVQPDLSMSQIHVYPLEGSAGHAGMASFFESVRLPGSFISPPPQERQVKPVKTVGLSEKIEPQGFYP